MRSPAKARRFFTCVLLVYGFCLFQGEGLVHASGSQEKGPVIRDERTVWTCLFTELEGGSLSDRYRYLTGSIPLLLTEELAGIPAHHLSEAERKGHRVRLLEKRIQSIEKELKDLIETRDDLMLRGEEKNAHAKEEEIASLRKTLSKLMRAAEVQESAEVSVEVEGELSFRQAENSGGRSLPAYPEIPIELYTEEKKADAVVYGELEQVEEALYLSLRIYNADTDSSSIVYRGALFPEEVEQLARVVSVPLTTELLGRDWAHLDIDVRPSHSTLRLGDRAYAGGDRLIRYLDPGSYRVGVEAPGYVGEERDIVLEPEEVESLQIDLLPEETFDLEISSQPEGARMYSGAVPLGASPVSIEETVLPFTILAQKEGFYDKTLVVEDIPEDGKLEIDLHPETIEKDRIVEAARKRFYRGVAGFFLTLPVTVISYGLSNDYAYAYQEAALNRQVGSDELIRLHGLSALWYTAYLSGLFMNGVFLTDSIVQIKSYIRAAEGR